MIDKKNIETCVCINCRNFVYYSW